MGRTSAALVHRSLPVPCWLARVVPGYFLLGSVIKRCHLLNRPFTSTPPFPPGPLPNTLHHGCPGLQHSPSRRFPDFFLGSSCSAGRHRCYVRGESTIPPDELRAVVRHPHAPESLPSKGSATYPPCHDSSRCGSGCCR
jgi:hypothetical protein